MRTALLLAMLGASAAQATPWNDGILLSWGGRDLEGMTESRWEAAKKLPCGAVAAQSRKAASWPDVYLAALAARANSGCKELQAALVEQLTDAAESKLTETGFLIVWSRIVAGDIRFEGHGFHVLDDVFTVAGRANFLLRAMTKHNFGVVEMRAPPAQLRELQEKWRRFLRGETVAEAAEPYPSTERGLSELRSPQAIEALIVSLGRTPSPMVASYLAAITDVPADHDAAWWTAWWRANRDKLRWSPERAKFLAGAADPK